MFPVPFFLFPYPFSTMNIWNTVFLVLILLLAVAGVFVAGREMKTQGESRQRIHTLKEKDIPQMEKDIQDLKAGTAPTKKTGEKEPKEMSPEELKAKLQLMISERKKAWFGCQPGNINPEGEALSPQQLGGDKPATPPDKFNPLMLVEVKLTITEPKNTAGEVLPPDGLEGIVYLFDEGQEGGSGSFLGRFMVKGVAKATDGYQVTLVSANQLIASEVDQIKKSVKSTWAVYLVVPMDRHDGIFDRLSSEELEALIPDKETRKLFESPDRQLRDFDLLLTAAYQRRVQLQIDIDTANRDIADLKRSNDTSLAEKASLIKDKELTTERKTAMERQRLTVEDQLNKLNTTINGIKDDIEFERQRNEWFISKIAEYQLKVAQLIEQKAEEAVAE